MKKVLWLIVCLMTMVTFTSCGVTTDCVVRGDESENGSIYCYRHRNYLENTYGSSSQCHAKTKDGKRCKRNAEKGSIYCWQHKYSH